KIESVSASGSRTVIESNGEIVTVTTISASGTVRVNESRVMSETEYPDRMREAANAARDHALSEASAIREGRTMGRKAARALSGGKDAREALMRELMAPRAR
ncbi:MAG: hypothetical protein EBR40_11580, partial [Proteobacteria bacterium]|nr:hypothetical protein [Pseudomonadota bacterium]